MITHAHTLPTTVRTGPNYTENVLYCWHTEISSDIGR